MSLPWPSRAGAAFPAQGLMAVVPGRLPLTEPMLAVPVRQMPADDGDRAIFLVAAAYIAVDASGRWPTEADLPKIARAVAEHETATPLSED